MYQTISHWWIATFTLILFWENKFLYLMLCNSTKHLRVSKFNLHQLTISTMRFDFFAQIQSFIIQYSNRPIFLKSNIPSSSSYILRPRGLQGQRSWTWVVAPCFHESNFSKCHTSKLFCLAAFFCVFWCLGTSVECMWDVGIWGGTLWWNNLVEVILTIRVPGVLANGSFYWQSDCHSEKINCTTKFIHQGIRRLNSKISSGWWFFTNPSQKYAQVKLDQFPQEIGGKHKKYLSCLVT